MYARFNGLLRPYQGFKPMYTLRRKGGVTEAGRPYTERYEEVGTIIGIISQASQKQIEQWKQNGHPITHTIVQRGTFNQGQADDLILLPNTTRSFMVKGITDPGEIGHFTIYYVEERLDLKMGVFQVDGKMVVVFGVNTSQSGDHLSIEPFPGGGYHGV